MHAAIDKFNIFKGNIKLFFLYQIEPFRNLYKFIKFLTHLFSVHEQNTI